eukprot:4942676-Pleurochrysis_carterae.AAC.1
MTPRPVSVVTITCASELATHTRTATPRSCGFESVVWTDSLNHARLSWRVLTILILYGIATRASIRVGKEPTIKYKIQPSGGWEQAQARGLRRAWAVVPGKGAHLAAVAIASESIREPGERSASAPQ